LTWRLAEVRNDTRAIVLAGVAFAAFSGTALGAPPSRCIGTVANGKLEHGVKMPPGGANFSSYSALATAVGRTYVHHEVAAIVGDAYAALANKTPDVQYVYGESGWASGGRFRPHRTHQNGLSVDFFVPLRDKVGRSVPFPTSASTRFGYDVDFDAEGNFGDYRIDFVALAEHLYELHRAAIARKRGLALVIFDPPYLPKLLATPKGPYLRQHIRFMNGRAWVRHDEHYHVDFAIPCDPLPSARLAPGDPNRGARNHHATHDG
jgi:penicillin-insensitive murein endopeptidase